MRRLLQRIPCRSDLRAGAEIPAEPGGDLAVKTVNALNEDAYATPAIADGRLYVRTAQALYAFGTN